jgi:glycerophosphoryl diester phosphodiesterase
LQAGKEIGLEQVIHHLSTRKVLRIGHRGAAGHAPENTLAAIKMGISLGVDYVELDVQRARDGGLVLMHDKFVERTTDGTGSVAQLNSLELRRLDAGDGERVPLLSEALAAATGHVGIVLESITPGIGPEIQRAVAEFHFEGSVIFSSFVHTDLLAIGKIDPSAMRMALLEGIPVSMTRFALEARASHVGLSIDSVTTDFVKALHEAGLQVFVYTVNDPRLVELAKQIGVDGVISDRPELI